MRHSYIFVVGGVMSSVGKGVTTASIGALLQAKGFRVTAIKADPYINVDAGTMNPTEHGEVFVTADGDETDQDMGNYERFLDIELTRDNYMTTGRVYQSVIEQERNLAYRGKCVEVVPHIPREIIGRIETAAKKARAEVAVIEIGGTVGEYQNILFLEAAREMHMRNPGSVAFVLVSYLPIPATVGEMKTKPTQYAARTLNSAGIQANFVVCRSERAIDKPRREKIATFCGIAPHAAISAPDLSSIYDVPILFERERFGDNLLGVLGQKKRTQDLRAWSALSRTIRVSKRSVKIAVVGKYFGTGDFTLADSYVSVIEALRAAAWHHRRKPLLSWIDAEQFEHGKKFTDELGEHDGILVPGGFGTRGIEGIIASVRYAREHKKPYLGLCYGMQLACVEFARSVCGLRGAHTVEVEPRAANPVIILNPYQQENVYNKRYGGTMRLGAYECVLEEGSRARMAYGTRKVSERHRHRYEFNNAYRVRLERGGMLFSGINPQQKLVEVIELPDHPWFVAAQFHPEFKSRPLRPHPLFRDFVGACIGR